MSLNELAREIHGTAVRRGWWGSDERPFGELLALIHSEVTEVLEEWRHGHEVTEVYHRPGPHSGLPKPMGIPIELADIIIRVLDLCAAHNIDIDDAMAAKLEYNKLRPWRHGGLRA